MYTVRAPLQTLVTPHSQGHLQDYITAIAWSPTGQVIALASAAGEVVWGHWLGEELSLHPLTEPQGSSIDTLEFSADGRFLAAGGQEGCLYLWSMPIQADSKEGPTLLTQLEHPRVWVDRLAWNPCKPELAFSLGHYVQVWDAIDQAVVMTVDFEQSSVLDLQWHPAGHWLAVSGQQGVKIWKAGDWDREPQILEMPSAGLAIACSPEGQYLASGNLDRTLWVWQQGNSENPWRMGGFPGKVRQLVWSPVLSGQAPLLASASSQDIVLWQKSEDDAIGWEARLLELHTERVEAIAFHPQSLLLATASADGSLGLWRKGHILSQIIEATMQGFSTVAWHPSGQFLVAGGQAGEWLIWRMF